MFSRISKSKLLRIYLANKRFVNQHLILQVFEQICEMEGFDFEFNEKIKLKIRYILTCIHFRWTKVLRLKTAKKKLLLQFGTESVDFEVFLKDPIEKLFNLLDIQK